MKRKGRSPINSPEPSSAVKELDGYVELGLKPQALRIVRRILAKRVIEPKEFTEAINTLGIMTTMRRWKESIETAYERQSPQVRRAMNADMVRFFYSINDCESTLRFLTPGEMKKAEHAVFVMELLIENKRMKEAHRVARCYEKMLSLEKDRFTISILVEALAIYNACQGKFQEALNLWGNAPLEQPFRQNALTGQVKVHLACALQAAHEGLKSLDYLKMHPDQETALKLPGNDEAMTLESEKALLALKRKIQKLLPESWWNIGGQAGQSSITN
jgi:hypothetical protein